MGRYMLYTDYYGCEEYHAVDTLETGLTWAKDTLINWMEEEQSNWKRENGEFVLTQSDIENWNFMIDNCEVYIVDIDRIDMTFKEFSSVVHTDKYDYTRGHYYYPLKKAQKLGWAERSIA